MGRNIVTTKDKGKKDFYEFTNRMEHIGKHEPHVDIGVLKGETRNDGSSMVDVAVWNELGVPSKNIPSRPFMRHTFDVKERHANRFLLYLYHTAGSSQHATKYALDRLGKWYEKELKSMIKTWTKPKNAPSTIKKKGKDDPLVDTEQLMNSIKYRSTVNGKHKRSK